MLQDKEKVTNIIQGDFGISENSNEILTTVLGSCISVCMCDPVLGVGGMNHFLLPQKNGCAGDSVRYGAFAMEMLINSLLKLGADKSRIEAKVFGGARMMGNTRDIGSSNAEFARQFLQDEGIHVIAESTGGTSARRIRYWPTTGRAQQLMVDGFVDEVKPPQSQKDDIVLF